MSDVHPRAARYGGQVWCFTSATLSYLDRVRILGHTLRRHHPDWTFCLCLADEAPGGVTLDLSGEPIDLVVGLDELAIPDLRRWTFMHDLVELCTAIKGPMLEYLFARGVQKVVYLDPDTAVFADLHEVEAILARHDVVLTPHLLEPETTLAAVLDNEVAALKHGIYNLGFFAVANTSEGRRFARWWSNRLLALCFDDIPNGLFTDQRWCDHAPVFFPTLHVLRDPGYNVASWNVAQRPVTIEQDGSIRAGGRPLRFFHFTKVDTVGGLVLEHHARRQRALFELMKWYADRLSACAVQDVPPGWWAYGCYTDGAKIPLRHRIAYRRSPQLQERFADPFHAGAGSLPETLERDQTLTT
jgi:hypothetical protein